MPNAEYCWNKKCLNKQPFQHKGHKIYAGGFRMVRIYIRQASDREYKTDRWKGKRYKQSFKPIGWLCPHCKDFRIEKKYQDEIQSVAIGGRKASF